MTTSDSIRLTELQARAKARGYELVTDDSGHKDRYYALCMQDRVLAYSPMTLAQIEHWLGTADDEDTRRDIEQDTAEVLAKRKSLICPNCHFDVKAEKEPPPAQTAAERAKLDLGDLQDAICEILHLARLGQNDTEDPELTCQAIARIANEQYDKLCGEFYDVVSSALEAS